MILSVLFLFQCSYTKKVDIDFKEAGEDVSHEAWSELLQKHLKSGFMDYEGMQERRQELQAYLEYLGNNPPHREEWTQEEQIAYWINLYNAATVELVLRHYPVESIKDIGSKIAVPFVNTPFDISFIKVGEKELSLNNIEHGILRKYWEEPRIHFAINCASFSCPALRNEAYNGETLNRQLDEQTRRFLQNDQLNRINPEAPQVSQIFSWFSGDFKKKSGTVINFINQYSKIRIKENADLEYIDYDWRLNDAADFAEK
ncbi:MAG: DUF547 domain-containing protein [Bacteroidia bacterium]